MTDWLPLLGFFAACFATAASGAIFTPGAWYEGLKKPWWRPPNWLFGPAWGVLFCMIAVAGWLVWRQAGFGLAMGLYALQLVLNFLWSAFFFGMKRPDYALYDLIALWFAILACIIVFAPISPWGMALMIPYIAWVTFAGWLNYVMLQLNGPRPA
ncbi:TspO/MBR family protein [Sediminicoccus rosea]|jgi:benzodiazapine receptor|uniref:TspO/MBR family protein n=1 Tax=Sediminicoccus rosea TaxID=1225128 RepID=A0ABZ0PLK2_9PROT|nr:TspO/MBR family protein [Sediminicoccus rosea]WPB86347.1 TspO/MBR family protein [Sediminicoccus rosea]